MIRQEQCDKVCRILDDVLANRPTERDSLIVAVQKAFNALEQPETNCSEIPNNSDTISRQAAIDACHNYEDGKDAYAYGDVVEKRLKTLPSAQPKIIRCKDCKFYGRADKRRFYRGSDCLNNRIDTIVPDRDFCSKAERREE